MSDSLRRLFGAILGGATGYLVFRLLEGRGYFAIAVVGACLAVGAGLGARRRHFGWGLLIGVLAIAVTAVVEWRHTMRAEESFWNFVTHPGSLSVKSQWSYVVVGLAGVWFGMGRRRRGLEGPSR